MRQRKTRWEEENVGSDESDPRHHSGEKQKQPIRENRRDSRQVMAETDVSLTDRGAKRPEKHSDSEKGKTNVFFLRF